MRHNSTLIFPDEVQPQQLEHCVQSKAQVSIYLTSGVRLKGIIMDFDKHTVLLKDRVHQLVYKRAISTIMMA